MGNLKSRAASELPVGGVTKKTVGASKTNAAEAFYAVVEHTKNVTVSE